MWPFGVTALYTAPWPEYWREEGGAALRADFLRVQLLSYADHVSLPGFRQRDGGTVGEMFPYLAINSWGDVPYLAINSQGREMFPYLTTNSSADV